MTVKWSIEFLPERWPSAVDPSKLMQRILFKIQTTRHQLDPIIIPYKSVIKQLWFDLKPSLSWVQCHTAVSKFIVWPPVLEMLFLLLLFKSALLAAAHLDCAEVCSDSVGEQIVPDSCCSNHFCACQNHLGQGRHCPAGEGWCSKAELQKPSYFFS